MRRFQPKDRIGANLTSLITKGSLLSFSMHSPGSFAGLQTLVSLRFHEGDNPLTSFCHVSGRRQWVKEEDLAKVLRLHPKQLRRTLRVLEEEMLVIREHRREVRIAFKMLFRDDVEIHESQVGRLLTCVCFLHPSDSEGCQAIQCSSSSRE